MTVPDSEDPDRVQIHPWISAEVRERLHQYCRLEARTVGNAVNLLLDRNLPPKMTTLETMTAGDGPQDAEGR